MRNLYEIIDRLRAKHPKLEIEACSGGGGRVDLGILRRVDEVWTSDNTDAFDRLRIQEGFHASLRAQDHVGLGDRRSQHERPHDAARIPLPGGHAGSAWESGANLNKWTPEDFALATKMIATYKRIRADRPDGKPLPAGQSENERTLQ